jgi:hypothetical protein
MRLFKMLIAVVIPILCLLFCTTSTVDPGAKTGTLVFDYGVANAMAKIAASDTNTVRIIDVKATQYKIEVASGTVVEGGVDNLDWHIIYESTTEMRSVDRVFPPVDLPVGNYNCLRITQKNRLYWMCEYGQDTLELPDLNKAGLDPDSISPINVFSDSGGYTYDAAGRFTMMANNERLGGFEIRENQTTALTVILNLNTLDWIDADSSGTWNPGDRLDNWTLVSGKLTMADFVVEYRN